MAKRGGTIASLVIAVALATVAVEASAQDQVDVVEKEEGTVESLLNSVWSTVRSMTPSAAEERTSSSMTVTAGLRGAEGESDALQPYWKGGVSQDPTFQETLEAYREAIEQGRQGNPAALEQFLGEHGDSDLAANAQFALGVAQADASNRGAARATLERFREAYPQHPLTPQAQQLASRLGG